MLTPEKILSLFIATSTPVMMWGMPGIGKTALIRGIADAYDCHEKDGLETVLLSVRAPEDLAGLPIIREWGVELAPPAWARRLANPPERLAKRKLKGILFLDEYNLAAPLLQGASLRVVHEGVVGDLTLPHGIAKVLAANPPDTSAGGSDMTAPAANRVGHVRFEPNPVTWIEGMVSGFSNSLDYAASAMNYEDFLPAAKVQIASFIKSKTSNLLRVPDNETQQGGPWPSPRTWDMAATLLAAYQATGERGAVTGLVAACVGDGPAHEFNTWLNSADLPDPEALLKDPRKWKAPTRPDIAFAALSSVAAVAVSKLTLERWNAAWEVLLLAGERDKLADIAAVAASTLVKKLPPKGALPPKVWDVFGPMLRAAGKKV